MYQVTTKVHQVLDFENVRLKTHKGLIIGN